MDFLKNAASKLSESNNNNNQQQGQQSGEQNQQGQNQQQNTNAAGAAPASTEQSSDYGDKAFDFISKKAGYDLTPEQDEKVTDGLRSAYESYSGKKVDSKYSN